MIRRAEDGEGLSRQQVLRQLSPLQIQGAIQVFMRDERSVIRAMLRRLSVQDQPLLDTLTRDIQELVGETVQRMTHSEWETWGDWDPPRKKGG